VLNKENALLSQQGFFFVADAGALISASSLIPLWDFPFKRYQDVSHVEEKQECLSSINIRRLKESFIYHVK
jgi:hypothetical protein